MNYIRFIFYIENNLKSVFLVVPFVDFGCEPVHGFVYSVTTPPTSCLKIPRPVFHLVETQSFNDLSSVHGVWQVLFVGKHQEGGFARHFFQHLVQFVFGFAHASSVIGVDHKYQPLGVLLLQKTLAIRTVFVFHVPIGELDVPEWGALLK